MSKPIAAQAGRPVIAWLLAGAVCALAFGGLGGSLQLSRVLCAALLPVVFLRLFEAGAYTRFQSEILVFALVLGGVGVASLAWSIDRTTTAQYLVVLALNSAPLLMAALLRPDEVAALRALLPRAWLLAGSAMLPLAFFELATGIHFVQGFEERGGGGLVDLLPFASGLHGNYNDFSLFLTLCVLGACFAGVRPGAGFWRRASTFSAIGLMSAVVLINSSRGAILCLAVVLAVRFLPMLPRRYLLPLVLAVPLLAVPLLGAADNDSLLLAYLKLKFSDFSGDLEAGDGRLGIFLAGLKGISSSYGLGVGAGAASSFLATDASVIIPNPHNLLLEWGLHFGVVGLCLFAWFLARLWAAGARGAQRKMIAVALLLLPVLGVIQSHLTGYTYFWLMLATLSVFAIEARRDPHVAPLPGAPRPHDKNSG